MKKATKEQLDKMLKVMDSDNSGEIDFEEFSSVMLRRVQVEFTPNEVKNAFEVIRKEKGCGNDTKLHKSHIIEFLDSFGTLEGEEDKSHLDLVEQIECDAHGYIDFREYVDMMMNF
jgi:calmodulin